MEGKVGVCIGPCHLIYKVAGPQNDGEWYSVKGPLCDRPTLWSSPLGGPVGRWAGGPVGSSIHASDWTPPHVMSLDWVGF